jgi:hypothetical protein
VRLARFDIVVLVETTSPTTARELQAMSEFQVLRDLLSGQARRVQAIAARNAKRVGDVDKTRQGTFLFNYFVGDDPEVVMQLWDYLAGWYQAETGMDNSTLLAPLEAEESDYVIINPARWDGSLSGVSSLGSSPRRASGSTCWPTWTRTTWVRCWCCIASLDKHAPALYIDSLNVPLAYGVLGPSVVGPSII